MKRLLTKALIVATLAIGALTGAAAPAMAVPVQNESAAASVVAEATGVTVTAGVRSGLDVGETQDTSNYLATARWQDAAASFHGRYDQFLQTDIIAASQRTFTQQTAMGVGNGLYSFSQGMLGLGLDMDPLNLLGEKVDKSAGAIGAAIFGSGGGSSGSFVAIIVIVVVAVTIFQLRRAGQKPWRKILTLVAIVALFSLMISGAQSSTTDARSGEFQPGFMSPGWFATKISKTITEVAGVPATSFLSLTEGSSGLAAPAGSGCAPYMANLNHDYKANSGSAIPQVISSLWETSGLTIWKQTQYGSNELKGGGTHGDDVFCHQLDWQAGITPQAQANQMFTPIGASRLAHGFHPKSAAWGADNNDERDRSLIAWTACDVQQDGSFRPRAEFTKVNDGECQKWWKGSPSWGNQFNIGGGTNDFATNIKVDQPDSDAAKHFVQTLHGNDTGSGLILVWTYAISALLTMFVFAGLGMAIAVAKIASLVMMLATFFILLMSVVNGSTQKLMGFLKTYLGFAVLAFGASVILAMISLISSLVSQIGVTMFGAGELMSLLWTGFSPLLAAYLLHMIFTKFLKLPSVFKPSSAMAWGAAGGAIGGVAGAAMMQRGERRAGRMAKNLARGAGRKVGSAAMGKMSSALGGRKVRKGGMVPKGAAAAGAGTATAGAGKGGKAGAGGAHASSGAPTVKGQEKIFGRRDSAGAGDVLEWAGESAAAKAAAAASGEKAVRPEFNKRVLRDARAFANGINPTNIPEGRLARIAQSAAYRTGAVSAVRSGRALSARIAADPKKYVADARASLSKGMGTVKSVASGRAHMVADALNEARHDPRAFIGGGARNAWGAVSGAASSSYGAAKEWAGNTALGQSVYDPRGAGIGLASFAGRSAVGAVAGSYEATRKAATFVRSNPNAQAALKVARNVAIGTVLGGPVGAIVGAASAHKDIARAGGRAVGSIRESFAVRDEAKIQAYAASIESFAPRHSPEAQDGPTMQRPERSQEAPRSIAPSPQPSEPELRWDTPTDHPSQEQWALIDIENDRRQAEIVRRANEESREMSEAIKRADQMRAAQAAQAARAQTAQARPAAVQNALKSPFSAAPASVSPVQVAPARATAQRAALPSPAATPRRVVAATPKRTPRAQ